MKMRMSVTTRREAMMGLMGMGLAGGFAFPALGRAARGVAEPFSWEALQQRALTLSREPWRTLPPVSPLLEKLDYDAMAKIGYRPERTLWGDRGDATGVRFFPLMKYARRPISIAVVEQGIARPFSYDSALFSAPSDSPFHSLGKVEGFSGFRVMNKGGIGDWLAFQGASYFRTAGALNQYGLSARGLAVDTGLSRPEEFPDFTHFWLEHGGDGAITVYALLQGPSVTGAYRFVNRKEDKGVVQDVSSAIFLRNSVERLGIAPLTSMFWYGEGQRRQAIDWRPEVHDSDGLAIHNGAGERIWRPLNNPPHTQYSSFADKGPRGFGLLQRDRNFDHYQDDAVFFEKRPSLWVEPRGDWGEGAVALFEIPTAREYDDNIVAFWSPKNGTTAGSRLTHDYRLRWIAEEPETMPVARIVNVWRGEGGPPGQPSAAAGSRLMVDFTGDRLAGLTYKSPVRPVVDVSGGTLLKSGCYPVVGLPDTWRMIIDIGPNGAAPVEIRAWLRMGNDALSETLLYQLF